MFRRPHSPVRLRRPIRGGVFHQLHAKMHRLPAHLTSEDDWKHDQPGVRLSRVFGVVLGIHIVAIGGLMAYEMFRHREPQSPNTTALRSAAREARPAPGAATRTTDAFADDPLYEGLKKHVVRSGERPSEIAALYGVDEKALLVLNRIGDARSFQSGLKLVIPNNQLKASAPMPPDRLLAAAMPAAPLAPAAAGESGAVPSTDAGDGLVPVTPGPYDPSLEVRRAEPVAETASSKPPAPSKTPAPAKSKPAPVVASTKKPAAAMAKKSESTATKPKAKGRVHVVKNGENAYRIAKAYGVNVDQLIKANGINPSALRPGTSLTIPPAR